MVFLHIILAVCFDRWKHKRRTQSNWPSSSSRFLGKIYKITRKYVECMWSNCLQVSFLVNSTLTIPVSYSNTRVNNFWSRKVYEWGNHVTGPKIIPSCTSLLPQTMLTSPLPCDYSKEGWVNVTFFQTYFGHWIQFIRCRRLCRFGQNSKSWFYRSERRHVLWNIEQCRTEYEKCSLAWTSYWILCELGEHITRIWYCLRTRTFKLCSY